MMDQHCHILWGVDDGAQTRQVTFAMLKEAREVGVASIVCTPHVRWSDFDQSLIQERFADFRRMASVQGIQATLGYEVYYSKLMEMGLDRAGRFVTEGTHDLLIEFNTGGSVPNDWERTINRLQGMGLDVIIAHPERYSSVQEDFELVYRMREAGCRIQVSAGDCLAGAFSKMARCAKRLIKEGLCDALVSDAHRPGHYQRFAQVVNKASWES